MEPEPTPAARLRAVADALDTGEVQAVALVFVTDEGRAETYAHGPGYAGPLRDGAKRLANDLHPE